MIISDLNYLEVTSEAPSVLGGEKKDKKDHGKKDHGKKGGGYNSQSNFLAVSQRANANAAAFGKNAKAIAVAVNISNNELEND